MSEAVSDAGALGRFRQDRVDNILNAIIATLVVALLALGTFFGLNVWLTFRAENAARPTARAVENAEAEVRANPNDANLRVTLGIALGADGQYEAAIEQFNNALRINKDHTGAYRGLGLVAYLQRDYDGATNYLLKVVELTEGSQYQNVNNTREEALFALGMIAIEEKHYEDAVGYLKGALRIRRTDSDTYYQLARAYRGLGESDAAIEQLDNALAFVNGQFPEALFMMGELYMEKGDEVNASYFFGQAARLAPDADPPQERLAQFGLPEDRVRKAREALEQGDIEAALKESLIARNIEPENADAAKMHGEVLVARKDYTDALAVYKEAAALAPDDPEIKQAIEALESRTEK